MRLQRGTCDATLSRHRRYVRELIVQLGEVPSQWDAHSLRAFVLNQSRRRSPATLQGCAAVVRMFVRFLIAEGQCTVGLDAAIPRMAQWRLAALPRSLSPDDVERVIASCNLASPWVGGIVPFCCCSRVWACVRVTSLISGYMTLTGRGRGSTCVERAVMRRDYH
jgi:site-specific recombinase XerC